MQQQKIGIIGAGPAGLTAAYLLSKHPGYDIQVFEQDPHYVGGISRTEQYKGFLFDIGGHRFFSKSAEVEALWTEILGDELLNRPRSSRIYYNKKFFSYPLVASDALKNLGLVEAARCVASYALARIKPTTPATSFEDWVSNAFGKRLFEIFFKTYTEKVWGMSCRDISADWAAQRIKGLSLSAAIRNAVFPAAAQKGEGEAVIKTLIDQFRYPRLGPGQMWETCKAKSEAAGVEVLMGQGVQQVEVLPDGRFTIQTTSGRFGPFDHLICSAPLRQLVMGMPQVFSSAAQQAAASLKYRDFITVVLILKERNRFSDNWIYIHDPEVKVGRVQNFKSWSPYMVPDPSLCCYGLEYFCFEGDGLWTATDTELQDLALRELVQIGLCEAGDLVDCCVVRQAKAYPVYDHSYQTAVQTIRQDLAALPNLAVVGRNGMHKYNNQDHSMMTAMLAVRNILANKPLYDLWQVNQDAEYHEEHQASSGGRAVPVAMS